MKIYKIKNINPPSFGYHVTYLSRLNNILSRGIVLPRTMLPNWVRTGWDNKIYLSTTTENAKQVADHIGLDRNKDWVLLRANNLDSKFISADEDWGNTWEESIQNFNTFAYSKSIPPSDIEVIYKAQSTPAERHDEFNGLNKNLQNSTSKLGVKIYRIANYIVDDFTLRSLNEWLYHVVPEKEIDITREKMLMWLQNSTDEDARYALDKGWRKVYDLTFESFEKREPYHSLDMHDGVGEDDG